MAATNDLSSEDIGTIVTGHGEGHGDKEAIVASLRDKAEQHEDQDKKAYCKDLADKIEAIR